MRHTALLLMISSSLAHCADAAVPRITRPPRDGDFISAQAGICGGPWKMGQSWRSGGQQGLRPGLVRFAWEPDAFWVLAELTDDFVTSRSTRHGESLWEMGDVFEVFIGRAGSGDYAELHVSPNNHRLALRWPQGAISKVRGGIQPLADFAISSPGFSSWVRRTSEPAGWEVLVRVPSELIPGGSLRAGDAFDVSFCRYDRGPEGTKKVLSSTSPYRERDFHRREEWLRAVLAQPSPIPAP